MFGFTEAYFFDQRRMPEVVIISKESRADRAASAILNDLRNQHLGDKGEKGKGQKMEMER